MERVKRKIRENIEEEQYGFTKGMETRNAIFVLRTVLERALEIQKDVYLCFVDFQKAFDTVKHEQMIEMLGEVRIDGRELRLITNLTGSSERRCRRVTAERIG